MAAPKSDIQLYLENQINTAWAWTKSAITGLPITQKRLDANEAQTDPMLQWAAIILAGAGVIWVLRKL